MTDKIWARKEGDTLLEVFPPLPDDFIPGENIFSPDWEYVEVTGVEGVAAGWKVQADGTVGPPPPPPGPSATELLTYANNKQESLLASVWEFDVGASAKLTTRLNDKGQAAMLQLLVWAKMLAQPNDVQHYNQADGSAGPDITPTQAINLAGLAGQLKTDTIRILNEVADGVGEGGTIETYAHIDALAWPVPKEAA